MMRSFTYPVQVYPHHTDYAGVVWHGAYVNWMEEVRVAFLEREGISYRRVTEQGCDLMVVELNLRYHRAAKMGESLLWHATIHPVQGLRGRWDYELRSLDHAFLYVTAQVTIVPVNRTTGKLLRRWPAELALMLCPDTLP